MSLVLLVKIDDRKNWQNISINPGKAIRALVNTVMSHLNITYDRLRISFYLTNDEEMRTINKEHRGIDKTTNVLSFPYMTVQVGQKYIPNDYCLGDIVLALGQILLESNKEDKAPCDHFAHLVVHGLLHLLGYDHEISDGDAMIMEQTEIAILGKCGISNPY